MNTLTKKYEALSQKIDIEFKNINLIDQAFIHRSSLNESKKSQQSNERLEFLGDSILSFLVSSYLYEKYPDLSEGELTNLRSSVVKTKTLADLAKNLDLGTLLYLSRGEEEGGGRNNPSLLADTFEALLGTIFLDQGISPVKKILETHLFRLLPKIIEERTYKDAKSEFQELVQEETRVSPNYKVVKEEGPDHAKEFTVGVYVETTLWGKGKGKSKQEAEMSAAHSALEKWTKK
ncbi:ribonuclease III [Candidatus Gottesmanbacteria bacterium]|nr:ribonuclease III [Candidatus Gottesmanbacteria bacterium]